MAQPVRLARRRKSKNSKKSRGSAETGDAFLLHASVLLCGCAAMAWAALQVVLYRSKEPALVIIPLMYPVAVMCAVVYERFWCERLPPSLHSRPTAAIRRSRLLAVRRARLETARWNARSTF